MDSVMLQGMVRTLEDSAARVSVRWRRLSITTTAMTGERAADMRSRPMSGRWDSRRTGISVRWTRRVIAIRCLVRAMMLDRAGMTMGTAVSMTAGPTLLI